MIIEAILKMILSAALGGIIGLEREFSHKDTGLKVNVLMAVGSAFMSLLAIKPVAIILAAGLIGAGIIIREKSSALGISSAVYVWLSCALGIAVGTGSYYTAFFAAIVVIGCGFLLKKISAAIEKQRKVCVVSISIEDNASVIIEIKRIMMELGLKYINPNVRKTKEGFEVILALQSSQAKSKTAVERLMHLPDVKEISIENL